MPEHSEFRGAGISNSDRMELTGASVREMEPAFLETAEASDVAYDGAHIGMRMRREDRKLEGSCRLHVKGPERVVVVVEG